MGVLILKTSFILHIKWILSLYWNNCLLFFCSDMWFMNLRDWGFFHKRFSFGIGLGSFLTRKAFCFDYKIWFCCFAQKSGIINFIVHILMSNSFVIRYWDSKFWIFLIGKNTLLLDFRFHPINVELVMYYVKRKALGQKLLLNVIFKVNIYKFAP